MEFVNCKEYNPDSKRRVVMHVIETESEDRNVE